MNLLALHIGDEVDIKIKDRNLLIQIPEKQEKNLDKIINNVFERRHSAYQQLAKGAS